MPIVRYRRDAGGLYLPGYPADPDRELAVSEDEAARLIGSGLYEEVAPEPPAEEPPAEEPPSGDFTPKAITEVEPLKRRRG